MPSARSELTSEGRSGDTVNTYKPTVDEELQALQRDTFSYFLHETNPHNGLVRDKTASNWPASIAATGFALAVYPVVIERGFITRATAIERVLATLRFFWTSPQGSEPNATGYRGFYYHFLDMQTGRRAWNCELSTVDSTILLAGALTTGAYFDADTTEEREIRALADALYRRADWPWAQNGGATVTHGWKPESGFLKWRWEGYDEALVLYILGLGSPTHPLPENSYAAWSATYEWKNIFGYDYLYAGPLFTHQISHVWIDFRGIQDAFMRGKGIDYFENTRRATYVHQRYAIDNPLKFAGYGKDCLGDHRKRRTWSRHHQSARHRAAVFRLLGARCAVRTRRRHDRALVHGGVSAVRAGDRVARNRLSGALGRPEKRTTLTASRRLSIRPTRTSPAILTDGCRRGTTGSIRGRSIPWSKTIGRVCCGA